MSIFYTKYRSLQCELKEKLDSVNKNLLVAKQPAQKVELHLQKSSLEDGLKSLADQLVLWRAEEDRLQQIFARIQSELTSVGPMNQVKYRKKLEAEPGLTEAYTLHQCKTPKL